MTFDPQRVSHSRARVWRRPRADSHTPRELLGADFGALPGAGSHEFQEA